uniref:Three-finger toxin n=1 Tax=Bungarus multicinctus TaxID=8616 RepID=E2IU15_BUNMU|nr:three-finger toxin precursor [Bungarus multicinctus]
MKTLLLTLVVVTIVCLDLGYTMKCKDMSLRYFVVPVNSKFVQVERSIAFKESWREARGTRIERGCAATCPKGSVYGLYVLCCTTDDCN